MGAAIERAPKLNNRQQTCNGPVGPGHYQPRVTSDRRQLRGFAGEELRVQALCFLATARALAWLTMHRYGLVLKMSRYHRALRVAVSRRRFFGSWIQGR